MNEVIENLYTTFASYKLGDDFVGCDDLIGVKMSLALEAPALRDLTIRKLEPYSRKAMTTWGTVHHFKFFLPRILELTINHRDEFLDLSIVFGKLAYAQLQGWPRNEREAVYSYFDAYWKRQLNCPIVSAYDDSVDSVLCALSNGLFSVESFLATWIATDTDNARKHLAAFILTNDDSLIVNGRLSNPFWERNGLAHAGVLRWLQSDMTLDYITHDHNTALVGEFAYAQPQMIAIRSSLAESLS